MAKTVEEKREYNRLKRNAYNARKRAEKAAQKTPGVVAPGGMVAAPGVVDEPELIVDVKAEDTPRQSLKDRILAKLQDPTPAKRPVSRAKKQENLLATTLPTVVCSFVATYSQQLIADPYKPCAPSQAEVTGMLGPLMDILARQIEITGKASQTTIDIMNSIICSMMYGVRAYITYVEIKKLETPAHAANQPAANPEPAIAAGLRSYQTAPTGLGGNNNSQYEYATNAAPAENYDASNGTSTANGAEEGERSDASIVADLFARDREGRVRLGLLRGDVRDGA